MELETDGLDRLGDKQFQALSQLVEAACGIRLPPTKRLMCEARLRRRVRTLNCGSLDAYAAIVLGHERQAEELPYLIDAVTTNKTEFFREPSHFVALRDRMVPDLLRLHSSRPARLKIWSAACSTGAEPFTTAMVLQDLLAGRNDFRFSVLGTDICADVLEEARAAIYPRSMAEQIPPEVRARYVMEATDPDRSEIRIVPELRRTVSFARLNLIDPPYPVDNDVDVIFCRNVLIYFERTIQHTVVRALVSHLRPGGFLVLGHSESMAAACTDRLRLVAPTIYRADMRE